MIPLRVVDVFKMSTFFNYVLFAWPLSNSLSSTFRNHLLSVIKSHTGIHFICPPGSVSGQIWWYRFPLPRAGHQQKKMKQIESLIENLSKLCLIRFRRILRREVYSRSVFFSVFGMRTKFERVLWETVVIVDAILWRTPGRGLATPAGILPRGKMEFRK